MELVQTDVEMPFDARILMQSNILIFQTSVRNSPTPPSRLPHPHVLLSVFDALQLLLLFSNNEAQSKVQHTQKLTGML